MEGKNVVLCILKQVYSYHFYLKRTKTTKTNRILDKHKYSLIINITDVKTLTRINGHFYGR